MKRLALLLCLSTTGIAAFAQGGGTIESIAYQGYLEDVTGSPLEGPHQLTFKLYHGVTSTLLWTEIHPSVVVENGVFAVELGSITSFASNGLAFDHHYLLGISVDGGAELGPRTPLRSVPYAMNLRGWLRVQPLSATRANPFDAANVIGGSGWVGADVVGATIGGGGNDDDFDFKNRIDGDYGTISGGRANAIDDGDTADPTLLPYGSIGGGVGNQIARGTGATIAGGSYNRVSAVFGDIAGSYGAIGGGRFNEVLAPEGTIGGGGAHPNAGATGNRVFDTGGTVGGGATNTAGLESSDDEQKYATVGGGFQNASSNLGATVAGGGRNQASGSYATVGGGSDNVASGAHGVVSGGLENQVSAGGATISGGLRNRAYDTSTTVAGGQDNIAGSVSVERPGATVSGGFFNEASGAYSAIPGGYDNLASGAYSQAAGWRAQAAHLGSFVWNDRSVTADGQYLTTTAANQFLVRAQGGVGIGTAYPGGRMTITRPAQAEAFQLELRNEGSIQAPNFDGIRFTQASTPSATPTDLAWIKTYYKNFGGADLELGLRWHNEPVLYLKNMGNVTGTPVRVGVGTNNPQYELDVAGQVNATNVTATSDGRYKRDVERLSGSLDAVMRLRGVRYRWDRESYPDRRFPEGEQLGLVAQEVMEVLPSVVSRAEDGSYSLSYQSLIPVLLEAVKEQQARIERLTAEVEALKAEG